ncbi:DUF2846 domain-containing protein [bacterium]|nr:DUF2846 domain-containing protein [bacterium]
MKRITFFIIMAVSLLLVSCGTLHMAESTQKPVLKASADKALLVVSRTTSYGGSMIIDNFVDQKFIGQTQSKSYFVAQIDPGVHYIISRAENRGCAKVNFEAGKTYFLNNIVMMGMWGARTKFMADKIEYFNEQLPEMSYFVLTPDGEIPVLSQEDFNESVADYEKDLKEEPEEFETITNITGYNL